MVPLCGAIYTTFLKRQNYRSREPMVGREWELAGGGGRLPYRDTKEFWGVMAQLRYSDS